MTHCCLLVLQVLKFLQNARTAQLMVPQISGPETSEFRSSSIAFRSPGSEVGPLPWPAEPSAATVPSAYKRRDADSFLLCVVPLYTGSTRAKQPQNSKRPPPPKSCASDGWKSTFPSFDQKRKTHMDDEARPELARGTFLEGGSFCFRCTSYRFVIRSAQCEGLSVLTDVVHSWGSRSQVNLSALPLAGAEKLMCFERYSAIQDRFQVELTAPFSRLKSVRVDLKAPSSLPTQAKELF